MERAPSWWLEVMVSYVYYHRHHRWNTHSLRDLQATVMLLSALRYGHDWPVGECGAFSQKGG